MITLYRFKKLFQKNKAKNYLIEDGFRTYEADLGRFFHFFGIFFYVPFFHTSIILEPKTIIFKICFICITQSLNYLLYSRSSSGAVSIGLSIVWQNFSLINSEHTEYSFIGRTFWNHFSYVWANFLYFFVGRAKRRCCLKYHNEYDKLHFAVADFS